MIKRFDINSKIRNINYNIHLCQFDFCFVNVSVPNICEISQSDHLINLCDPSASTSIGRLMDDSVLWARISVCALCMCTYLQEATSSLIKLNSLQITEPLLLHYIYLSMCILLYATCTWLFTIHTTTEAYRFCFVSYLVSARMCFCFILYYFEWHSSQSQQTQTQTYTTNLPSLNL